MPGEIDHHPFGQRLAVRPRPTTTGGKRHIGKRILSGKLEDALDVRLRAGKQHGLRRHLIDGVVGGRTETTAIMGIDITRERTAFEGVDKCQDNRIQCFFLS